MAKGIPTRPAAKRLNKLPVILIVSTLVLIVFACFYAVNKRQTRLQNPAQAKQTIETAPINNNTPKPDFFSDGYINELDQQKILKQDRLKTTNTQGEQILSLEKGSALENADLAVIKEQKQPLNQMQNKQQVPRPFYQEPPPNLKPEKSPKQIFKEKVAAQKREAALKALRAPTTVNISTASQATPQTTLPPGITQGRNPYHQAQMPTTQSSKSDQDRKNDFLDNASESKVVLTNAYRPALSPFELKQGHLIPMTLITKINSDLPGRIKAQVTENVYDTATGNYLLIPQGTMINGIYDSQVVFGQKRVLIAWQRLIFPDGSSLNVGSMPGTDQQGTSGLEDLVDNHYFQIFGAAILMSVVNAGFTLATETDSSASDKETAQDSLAKAAAQQMQQTFSRLIDKIMSIQPELIIRQGKQGHIILTKDVVGLKPYDPEKKPTYYLKTVQVN